ncbi:MAG: DUF1273 domain-containing protein [Ruminococcaceae bacterium]|nr:DUF1273 domain-containing protein [Oscillospiraceae bacterium]
MTREKEKSCCFTGHRIISRDNREFVIKKTYEICENLIAEGYTDFIAGGALGFDTVAARCILDLKEKYENIRLTLALPCENQYKGWKKSDIEVYEQIAKMADEVIYVSEEYYPDCMKKRNRFMVDESSVCVAYLTRMSGGTAYTVTYAVETGKKIIFVK